MKEEWKIIEDTFGKYSVSNLGNVRIRDQINKKLNDYEVR